MKYLLINQKTGEETICDKVTIDGFEYYACRGEVRLNDPVTDKYRVWFWEDNRSLLGTQKVIATTNPNINIPQVVDETDELSKKLYTQSYDEFSEPTWDEGKLLQRRKGFIEGYNKSQETHPFSEEDMAEFADWVDNMGYRQVANGLYKSINDEKGKLTKQLLQLWKSQQPQKIYYTQTAAK